MASDKYSLHDVLENTIPTHIAIILDNSGSMYGEAFDSAKVACKRFIEKNVALNRSLAIFTTSGNNRPIAGPTNDPAILLQALNESVAIGDSDIYRPLHAARRALKDRGAIFVIFSDGHIKTTTETEKECSRIRKQGGRIFGISIGPNPNQAYIKSLCAATEDYSDAYEEISIKHALNNILTQVDVT